MKTKKLQAALFISALLCMFISYPMHGQVQLRFRLDVSDMVDKDYFKTGDRIFVRGSFNNWQGNEHELFVVDSSAFLFSKTIMLELKDGEKFEYKFVIITPEGREYWEEKPEPENGRHGNRVAVVSGTEMLLPPATFDYGEEIRGRNLSWPEKLRADYMQARQILEETHPALYDYTPKAKMDSLFDYYYRLIDEKTTYETFYRYLSLVMAPIGCGHTKLFIPVSFLESKPDHYFPLQLLINTNQILVSGTYGPETDIPTGSRLAAINGTGIQEIVQAMIPLESADGLMESFKINSIQKRFPEKYAMMYGFPDTFFIEYYPPGERKTQTTPIEPASFGQFKGVWKGEDILAMKEYVPEKAALITINTFGYYHDVPMFRAFIDSCFTVVKEKNIENLIIDLRGNNGGDPWCASYLFSYLENEPLPYFEEAYSHYEELAEAMPLPDNHFSGNAYVLIDGAGFSTTGHLCGLLSHHGLVTFVGTDLGASYTCTGNTTYPQLHNTQLFLGTARERRYTAAVKDMDPTIPVKADHYIEFSQEDLLLGRDGQIEYILKLIR